MPFKRLSRRGKQFIERVAATSDNLIQGRNNYSLPFTNISNETEFRANIDGVKTNADVAERLKIWFEQYAFLYDLDSNIIAAQTFQESRFRLWNYAGGRSSASGIAQFTMTTMSDVIINRGFTEPRLTDNDIVLLTSGMEKPFQRSSYRLADKNPTIRNRARFNRVVLFQNMLDHTEIMIKVQCNLMRFISNRNNEIAASCLFAYNRGSGLTSETYGDLIKKTKSRFGENYIIEGVNYVNFIFGYLGDQNHTNVKKLDNTVRGFSFGYKIDFTSLADFNTEGTNPILLA